MKTKIQITCFVLITVAFNGLGQSLSPSVIASGGNDLKTGNWALSTTLGEAVIATAKSSNYILTQGFQQGPVILLGTRKDYFPGMDIRVFPNPASSFVTITVSGKTGRKFDVIVFDIYGRIMEVEPPEFIFSESLNMKLNLSSLARGTYILRITDEENKMIFSDIKIVKIR